MVERLVGRGLLRAPGVINAFRTVHRHRFVSALYLPAQGTASWVRRSRASFRGNLQDWFQLIYGEDQALIVDHSGGQPTVTSTAPWVMAVMLEALDVVDGGLDRPILEIGTGTGYNAALLAAIVKDPERVVTIDINSAAVSRARRRIARVAGTGMIVRTADGMHGYPSAAPFAAIVATAGVSRVPRPWLNQLAVGGKIVACLQGRLAGGILVVERSADATYRGWFLATEPTGFIPMGGMADLRGERLFVGPVTDSDEFIDGQRFCLQDLDRSKSTFPFWLQFEIPAARLAWELVPTVRGDPVRATILNETGTTNSVRFLNTASDRIQVEERGGGGLWARIIGAWTRWRSVDRPTLSDYCFRIEGDGSQAVELRQGGNVTTWIVAGAADC